MIDQQPLRCWFQVADITEDAILGVDTLQPYNCQWDWQNERLRAYQPLGQVEGDGSDKPDVNQAEGAPTTRRFRSICRSYMETRGTT